MKNYDYRKADIVRLRRDLEADDVKKILKFVGNFHESAGVRDFVHNILDKRKAKIPPTFTVDKEGKTERTETPYIMLRDETGVRFAIQARYAKLLIRKPRHPLTPIFQDVPSPHA